MKKSVSFLQNMSKRRADALSNGAFLISLGALFFTDAWFPGIFVAIWIALGLREALTGRWHDFAVSTITLLGLFLIASFDLDWMTIAPVLFTLGGIYIIFREYYIAEDVNEEDEIKNIEDHVDEGK